MVSGEPRAQNERTRIHAMGIMDARRPKGRNGGLGRAAGIIPRKVGLSGEIWRKCDPADARMNGLRRASLRSRLPPGGRQTVIALARVLAAHDPDRQEVGRVVRSVVDRFSGGGKIRTGGSIRMGLGGGANRRRSGTETGHAT
jgi:hypothetical protein